MTGQAIYYPHSNSLAIYFNGELLGTYLFDFSYSKPPNGRRFKPEFFQFLELYLKKYTPKVTEQNLYPELMKPVDDWALTVTNESEFHGVC